MDSETPIDESTPDLPESLGGNGGRCGRRSRLERLAERALRESWPVPEKIRGPLISRLAMIALDKDTPPREAVSASKAIMRASQINLAAIGTTINANEHEELAERVAELEGKLGQQTRGGDTWR